MELLERLKESAHGKDPLPWSISGRIVYVVSHSYPYSSNGYAVRTHGIASALVKQGYSVVAINRPGRPWDIPGSKIDSYPRHKDIDGVRYVYMRYPSIQYLHRDEYLKAAAKALKEAFHVFKPSAVIAASNWENALPAGVAAREMGLPFFYEVRGFWEISRISLDPEWENTDEFQKAKDMESVVARSADWVFTLNKFMRQELVRRGVDENKIDLVPNGYNELPDLYQHPNFSKKDLGITSKYVVGYVGSFSEYEGLDDLIRACAEVRKQGVDVSLLLVGSSNPSGVMSDSEICPVSSDYQKLAQKLEFGELLFLPGRVPQDYLGEYYRIIDIVVIPRKKMPVSELVPPMKVTEALTYEKTVVVSDVDPLAEYADNHQNIFKFAAGKPNSLAGKLVELLGKNLNTENTADYSFFRLVEPLVAKLSETQVDKTTPKMVKVSNTHIESRILMLSGNSKQEVAKVKVPTPGATLELSAAIVYRLKSAHTTRKAVLLFNFLDSSGNRIMDVKGIGFSSAFEQQFRYMNSNSKTLDDSVQEVFKLKLPEDVVRVTIAVAGLGLKSDENIDIRIQGGCYSEKAKNKRKRRLLMRQPLPTPIVHDPKKKRYTSDLTIACVLDEFTAECLSYEVQLIKVTQEAWQVQLEQNPPDFLLVESCWKGNDGNWGTLTKGSGGSKKLNGLLRYCKQNGIHTVFWNKEDPTHYEKFGPIAKLFDLAITTDLNMVPRYKKDFGIDVYTLSFAAQPKIHNPEPFITRLEKAVFAGSYYADKPERCTDFNKVMSQIEQAGIQYNIYDRNYHQNIEKFAFPDHYQAHILGNLPPEEVWKAHKGYKYQININSVKNSATMFARRVYESLASGTPVISNDSVGVRELFGDIVIMPGKQSIAEKLRALEASPPAYRELARRGVRAVMRDHTYGHRIHAICCLLGIEVEVDLPKATLAITASSEADIQRAKRLFEAQTAPRKHLFIELENFDTAYQFLNASNETVTFAMQIAHEFYAEELQYYYGNDRVLRHNVNEPLAAEALEDFIYWGEGHESTSNLQTDNKAGVSK